MQYETCHLLNRRDIAGPSRGNRTMKTRGHAIDEVASILLVDLPRRESG